MPAARDITRFPSPKMVGPRGQVYAVDIQPLALRKVKRLATGRKLSNITTVLLDSYDTQLPANVADVVMFLDAFHIVEKPEALLREIHRLMKRSGLLFLDPGHLKAEPVLRRAGSTGRFTLLKLEDGKMFLSKNHTG